MKFKLVIIGLGNIGKRHLQAISRVGELEQVSCYDLNQETLNQLERFCADNNLQFKQLNIINDYKQILTSIDQVTIVVVATTAVDRKKLLFDIMERQPRAIVAEKPLCQTDQEYQEILTRAEERGVPIYLNFTRHMFAFYQQIKNDIHDKGPVDITATFPGGMACIGIHMLELTTWLLDAHKCELLYVNNCHTYETKRDGFHDFTGEMVLLLDSKNTATMKAIADDGLFSIKITSGINEYLVYEFAKKIITVNAQHEIKTIDIEIPFVSQLTDLIVKDIIKAKDKAKLPTIQQAYLAHKMLFDYITNNKLEGVRIT